MFLGLPRRGLDFDLSAMCVASPLRLRPILYVDLLMWDMRRNLNTTPMPARRSVVEFVYPKLPAAQRHFWLIVDPETGRAASAHREDLEGLEQEGAWTADHIKSRILDAYAGRPNLFVESFKPRL